MNITKTNKVRKTIRLVILSMCLYLFFTQFAFAGENNTQKFNLSVARETLNGYTYQVKTDNSVMLNWEAQSDAESYTLEKSNNKGKVLLTKNISGSENSYMVKGLKPNTTYYFRIYATKDEDVIAESIPLTVTTFSKTTGYFYEKVVVTKEWPGVLITTKQATEDQIEDFNNVEEDMKPAIKYNYASSEKKLYINAFVQYVGDGKEDKFEYYRYSKKTGKYEPKGTANVSYKKLISSGIKDYWSFDVKGSSYDFKPGVKFSTEVVLIEKKLDHQNYINFYVGEKEKKLSGVNCYWFFSSGCCEIFSDGRAEYNYDFKYYPVSITMPTQAQLSQNQNEGLAVFRDPKKSISSYAKSAAHEFGHALGLDDAYKNGKLSRCKKTAETGGPILSGFRESGLMGSGNVKSASANDLEMALTAQGMAINEEKNSWQAFADYVYNNAIYVKSKAIRMQQK